jgi:hypothetical protein
MTKKSPEVGLIFQYFEFYNKDKSEFDKIYLLSFLGLKVFRNINILQDG